MEPRQDRNVIEVVMADARPDYTNPETWLCDGCGGHVATRQPLAIHAMAVSRGELQDLQDSMVVTKMPPRHLVEYWFPSTLIYEHPARRMTWLEVAASMPAWDPASAEGEGPFEPITLGADWTVLDGHKRIIAALLSGVAEISVLVDDANANSSPSDPVGHVLEALNNPGRRPSHHRRVLERLNREWPTLFRALQHLNDTEPRYSL